MSQFTVTLQNQGQGTLDRVYTLPDNGGTQQSVSIQRTVFVMGPKKINRLLADGDTFTDCNYFKKFTYAAIYARLIAEGRHADEANKLALEQSFLVCTLDDGSTWDEGTNKVIGGGASFLLGETAGSVNGSSVDFATTDPTDNTPARAWAGFADFCRILNLSAATDYQVVLNGTSTFTLAKGSEIIFDAGDMRITSISVPQISGIETDIIEVFCTIMSEVNS